MKLIGRIGGPVGILTGRTGLPRVLLLALVLVPCLTGGAHAALTVHAPSGIGNPHGYVYDDVNDFYWLRDLSLFTNTAFEQQKTDIGNYEYYVDESTTWDDWRMATKAEMITIWRQGIANVANHNGYNYDNTYFYWSMQGTSNTYWRGRIDLTRADPVNPGSYQTKYCGYWNGGSGQTASIGPEDDGWGWISPEDEPDDIGAWVVRDGTPEIPEPATAALLGVAMLGAAGTLIRKRARQQ